MRYRLGAVLIVSGSSLQMQLIADTRKALREGNYRRLAELHSEVSGAYLCC